MKMFWYFTILFVVLVLFAVGVNAQTPPVSTVLALPDTTIDSQIRIDFTVDSDIAWESGGGVGIYYRSSGMLDWAYAKASTVSPIFWNPPFANTSYEFTSTVADNEGNNEGYEFVAEANTFYLPGALPPDLPTIKWHWTHPTTGSSVVEYIAEVAVNGLITVVPGIAVGDTTFAYLEVPYAPNSQQTIRVAGVDYARRQGEWSEWAETWIDAFPGQPSKPQGMLVVRPQD